MPGTIRENLRLSDPAATEEAMWAALAQVRLEAKVRSLADGLDTSLVGTTVSGGERQRVALARAVLHAPDVLLLDEATAQVDGLTEAAVHAVIEDLARDRAVVTIAHRLSTVIDADVILVMEDGRVRARGTHPELLATDELYRELVAALRIATEEAPHRADPGAAMSSAPARGRTCRQDGRRRSRRTRTAEGEGGMGNVTCDVAVSVDGYSSRPDQTLEHPFGAGVDLHRWMFETADENAAEIAAIVDAGAFVMGRNMFTPGRGEWDPGWRGWWGPEPPYHAPVFVLTHHPREPLVMEGGTTFFFVTDGIGSAVAQARAAAGTGTSPSQAGLRPSTR